MCLPLFLTCVPGSKAAQTPTSSQADVDIAALRNAIEDLRSVFASDYDEDGRFLDRLGTLERVQEKPLSDERRQALNRDLVNLRREALSANPLVRDHPILFVVRHQYARDHHNTATFFPKASTEYNDGAFRGGGAVKLLNLNGAKTVVTLMELPEGVARDPEVHFDGRRVVFSMRRSPDDSYHLYEMDVDGTNLRQLTFAEDVDDLDPVYLPEGDIVFSSTREPKYCMCNRHIMANLHRMRGDGANIHQIGKSTLFEGHASLLPDGRILYDRWEYVDRNFGDAQGLWTANPDGTGHLVFWGNNTASPGGVIDARPIPDSTLVMAILGSCHDRPWGALAILDRQRGLDGREPVLHTWPADAVDLIGKGNWDTFMQVPLKYEDPFPLSDPARPGSAGKYFLCARMTGIGEQTGIYLIDIFGNELLLHAEEPGCFDPMSLRPRPRPPVLPSRRDWREQNGEFLVQDVYEGTHMNSVKRGAVKWLRVVEVPEKRFWTRPTWNGQGIEGPAMNWHDFNNKRILGQVPVEEDGSAYFTVPAERFVYFQLLDSNGRMVQTMRSGTLVQGGERQGCVGCHDNRLQAPPVAKPPLALQRDPSTLKGWRGLQRPFSYAHDVQPVFDAHCVRCHDFNQPAGDTLNLAGDRTLVFNTSYVELWRKGYLNAIGAGPADLQPAYGWGSTRSRLLQERCGDNRGVRLSDEDLDRLITWIDLNGPYYPFYACAYPDHLAGRAPLDNRDLNRLSELTGLNLAQLADHSRNQGPQVNFDRPELSPCLARIASVNSPEYREALNLIRTGGQRLAQKPEADHVDFESCPIDQWRDAQYVDRQNAEERRRTAIRNGTRYYDTP